MQEIKNYEGGHDGWGKKKGGWGGVGDSVKTN